MSIKQALIAYTEEKYNCAQSILRGFRDQFDVTEESIQNARHFGGGRAENGVCGALYAACLLIQKEDGKERIRTQFASAAGSEKCREIRSLKHLSCGQCVELAAQLLEKEIK